MMGEVGVKESVTQKRIVKLFTDQLGYTYLGNWREKENGNIETERLKQFLQKRGYSDKLIERALRELKKAASEDGDFYEANKAVYSLLRYGVKVKEDVDKQNQTVWLINWKEIEENDFAIAEEVTVRGESTKRPDLVLYLNGIAIGVIELKRSTTDLAEGIRQNLKNQQKGCIGSFFTTMQLVMAGNDTQGLRYGMIGTKEKYYLEWNEEGGFGKSKLDRHLSLLCEKNRLLDLIHNFIVFDRGVKKICRHNQYFGVKKAEDHILKRQGGIIWHTQGSGKSLTMVWLTRWIRENVTNSRVLIITDRKELDGQIEKIYFAVDESVYRAKSGADLMETLNATTESVICSLIHKFGSSDEDKFLKEIQKGMPSNFSAKGNIYLFVDECHRTQSGKLHAFMKKTIPKAPFIGFTGTPILKSEKRTSREIFGSYIHIYNYDKAVEDGVVLELRYESRHVDQKITSHEEMDNWFAKKTRGLNEAARAKLKKKWATMENLLSARTRLGKIVADILFDMETKDRLADGRGNAMLVARGIHNAFRFYELFCRTDLFGKCAVISSHRPSRGDTETGESDNIYKKMLCDFFNEQGDRVVNRGEEFEKKAIEKFVKKPDEMRLLIVVDKLLTGFDAPSLTYLYIVDKKMQDHSLFQAVCRVNRLDNDKECGYIVDYTDLFNSLKSAMNDFTSGGFDGYDEEDIKGFLNDHLIKAGECLDQTRKEIKTCCEGVPSPKDSFAYIKYFCGDNSDENALKRTEPRRLDLYKKSGSFIRAYANLANDMPEAGYSPEEIKTIKDEVRHYGIVRKEIKVASRDYKDKDPKVDEPGMRHLIDTYIEAGESQKISDYDNLDLTQLFAEDKQKAIEVLPEGIRNREKAVAATIENNIRKLIIDEQPTNPKYYKELSKLLDELIEKRRKDFLGHRSYLEKLQNLARKALNREENGSYPQSLDSPGKRALYDNLGKNEELALGIDKTIIKSKRAGWQGNQVKERELKEKISDFLESRSETRYDPEEILKLVKTQNDYK